MQRLSSITAVKPQATSDSFALRRSSPAGQVIHRPAHLQSQRDQTLLGTVVQVTLDAAASVVDFDFGFSADVVTPVVCHKHGIVSARTGLKAWDGGWTSHKRGEEIKTQFEEWSARRLDDVEFDYLFLDGSHFKYHANAAAEPVLAAWGIDTDGKPVFVGLEAAASESGDAWEGFLTGLSERGLVCPLLVISDGAAGLIGAAERTMGAALRQRCLIHRARNILAKVPKNAQADVKADYWAIFDLPEDVEPGIDAVKLAQNRIDAFATRWFEACTTDLLVVMICRQLLLLDVCGPAASASWVTRSKSDRSRNEDGD